MRDKNANLKLYIILFLLVALNLICTVKLDGLESRIEDLERENTLIKEQVVQLYDYVYERNMEE